MLKEKRETGKEKLQSWRKVALGFPKRLLKTTIGFSTSKEAGSSNKPVKIPGASLPRSSRHEQVFQRCLKKKTKHAENMGLKEKTKKKSCSEVGFLEVLMFFSNIFAAIFPCLMFFIFLPPDLTLSRSAFIGLGANASWPEETHVCFRGQTMRKRQRAFAAPWQRLKSNKSRGILGWWTVVFHPGWLQTFQGMWFFKKTTRIRVF